MLRILVIAALAIVTACATGPQFHVSTSALANPSVEHAQTFELWPLNEGVEPSDLQFLEYSSYIERALEAKGMSRVESGATPDILVLVGYGIGDPEKNVRSYSIPVFGQTGVSSSYTSGTATTNVFGSGNYATGTTNYNATTTYTPSYGITGYQSGVQTYTTYTRYISLMAAFVDTTKSPEDWLPAFETAIVSTGSSGDLRRVFPIMIAAAAEKIGKSTQSAELDTLQEDDPRVLAIKGQILQ